MESTSSLWHPYTQMKTALEPPLIVRGEGTSLFDAEGRRYLDANASWWVNVHGHCHPYICEKIKKQLDELDHVMAAGVTHQPVEALAKQLIQILPGSMKRIFFSDNGSTAVETALKMALQFWTNQDPKTKRKTVVSMRDAYHGETFGCMSASSKTPFHSPFSDKLFPVERIDPPFDGKEEESLIQLEKILKTGNVACFLYEPLLLGAFGGMRTYSAKGLNSLLEMCHQYQVITIADEVLTGFGRTGPLFASEQPSEYPKIICLAKSLTGGTIPLAATACTEEIFTAFFSQKHQKAFLHGHSYTANPLGCVAALANIELLLKEECEKARWRIAKAHETFASRIHWHPLIHRVSLCGTILALELFSDSNYFDQKRETIISYFLNHGILLRPLGNVLYLLPPYCITDHELHYLYSTISSFLEEA